MKNYIFTVRIHAFGEKQILLDTWLEVDKNDGDLAQKLQSIEFRLRFNNDMYPSICMINVPTKAGITADGFEQLLNAKHDAGTLISFLDESRLNQDNNQLEAKEEPITQSEFDDTLIDFLKGKTANELLTIPGIYEILSEEFNNDVINLCRSDE